MNNLNQFVDAIISNGGATFNISTGISPSSGFVVSKKSPELNIELFGDDVTRELLVVGLVGQFIRENGFELSDPSSFLGGWIHNNRLYIGVSMVYDTNESALKSATNENQLAYYDIENDKSIFIGHE